MNSDIRKAKEDIGNFWEYRRLKDELESKLYDVKVIRKKIKEFEEVHEVTKPQNEKEIQKV